MSLILYYKDYRIGKLDYNGGKFVYESLPQMKDFVKEYGFLNFDLKDTERLEGEYVPPFFAKLAESVVHNSLLATELNINLEKETYYDVLEKYANLPQVKNTFHLKNE